MIVILYLSIETVASSTLGFPAADKSVWCYHRHRNDLLRLSKVFRYRRQISVCRAEANGRSGTYLLCPQEMVTSHKVSQVSVVISPEAILRSPAPKFIQSHLNLSLQCHRKCECYQIGVRQYSVLMAP